MKPVRRWGVVIGAAIFAVAAVLAWDAATVGRALDAYRGVTVYDNGLLFFRSRGRHVSAEGYYLGQKWQCVEYIKRFYFEVARHRMPDPMGHARDFFDPSISQGVLNARRGLLQFRNGGNVAPLPGDLLVFRDTTYGHVAIVTTVTTNSVEVIQQNIFGRPRQSFELHYDAGRVFITAPREPAGWLRLPAASTQSS
jgi:hypothetical protein